MNYIKELNAFYDRLETNPCSTSAIALWGALMNINNKAGWIGEFAVAVSVLSIKTGLSERSVSNARNELKQKGYIDFKSRKGNQSAIYKLNCLSEINADKISDTKLLSEINADKTSDKKTLSAIVACNTSDSLSDNASDSLSDNASVLIKLNKTKQNDELNINNIGQEVFLPLLNNLSVRVKGIYELEQLESYLSIMDPGLIIEAIKRSEKKSVPYCLKVLEDWKIKCFTHADDLLPVRPDHIKSNVTPFPTKTTDLPTIPLEEDQEYQELMAQMKSCRELN